MSELIDPVLAIDPAADAIEFEGEWTTWGELARAKSRIEALLRPHGPGLRVGVMIRNRTEVVAALLACTALDLCIVTLNPVYPDDSLAEDLSACDPPVLIAGAGDWDRPAVAEAAQATGAMAIELVDGGEVRLRAEMAKPVGQFARGRAEAVGVEMLTSGTTGKPKRIPLGSEAFSQAVLAALNFEKGRSAGDAPRLRGGVQFLTAPMAHIGGLMAMLNAVIAGRRAYLMERFDVGAFHDAIVRHQPKVVGTPPAALKMLLDAGYPREDFSSLVAYRTGTAPLDPDLAEAFYRAYGVPVLQNYGATEFGGVAGWTIDDFRAHWAEKRGSVGRVNPNVEARIVDEESREPLPPGEEGVLQLRGKQIADGESWLTTTDLARLDADNFLFILGRADNAIIRGGFKVHPDTLVEALEKHEAVLEAAVVGLPDPRLGTVPAAAYRLKGGTADPGGEALARFLRGSLAPYQIPVRFMRVEDFPRTISMKADQRKLRALFLEVDERG